MKGVLNFGPCMRVSQCRGLGLARLPVNHYRREPMDGKPIKFVMVS